MTTQTIYGRVSGKVYSRGRNQEEAGLLYLEDMMPETAYVKLGWLLGKEKDEEKVKELMLKNIAHEFNERISEKDFLI
jgi:glutamyl-tRNA(Gln) amidotransferase subunit D